MVGGVDQVTEHLPSKHEQDSEFKPQYRKKKRKREKLDIIFSETQLTEADCGMNTG
jgi:hypothetical protein